MRTTLRLTSLGLLLSAFGQSASAQGTAFTYQGRLDEGSSPANGSYDLRVVVFDAASGGNQRGLLTNNAVGVSNGLFTTTLDFGFGVFNGGPRWLELGVRSNGTAASFSTLLPRQAVLPTPYAFWSANASQAVTVTGTVPASGLDGLYSNPVNFSNPGNSFIGGFAGDGTGLNNVNAAQLGGRSAAQFWQTGGNAGANPTNGSFLGTTDNQPVEFKVNNVRILRLEPHAISPNLIGGHPNNNVSNGVAGAFIGGGGNAGFPNRVEGNYATVPGGLGNTASGYASLATGQGSYAAGSYSTAMGDRAGATGPYSTALGSETWAMGPYSTALGLATTASGDDSTALGLSTTASGDFSTALGQTTVASGDNSTALGRSTTASGDASTGLGEYTRAIGNYSTALGAFTAAGGESSTAMGSSTLTDGFAATAMGYRARALHDGSFVWADTQEADFDSTSTNQFSLRASGGVWFETGGAGLTVDGRPALLAAESGQSLVFSVNSTPALRIEPTSAEPNVIGGYEGNIVSNGVVGAFIGGGGDPFGPNRVGGNHASVLGGRNNVASGVLSTAMGYSTRASGGVSTAIGYNTAASGDTSTAMGDSCSASGIASTAMGYGTTASGHYSTAMGRLTLAGGSASTALGYRARALHDGSFVWADATGVDFDSTAANQFSIRASGGVRLVNDTSLNFGNQTRQMINLWNAEYAIGVQADAAYARTGGEFFWYRGGSHSDTFADAGGGDQLMRLGSTGNLVLAGTLSQGSDQHIKQDFTAVNPQAVLDKVAALRIQTWAYTNDASRRHLGPVAQDFHAAFGLNGADDKHIATVDADGVALAAIQGLNQRLTDELKRRDAENAELKRALADLKEMVERSAQLRNEP